MNKFIAVLLKRVLPLVCVVSMLSGCMELWTLLVAGIVTGIETVEEEIDRAALQVYSPESQKYYMRYSADGKYPLYDLTRIQKGVYSIKIDGTKIDNNVKTRDETINSFINTFAQSLGYESYDLKMTKIERKVPDWEYSVTMPGSIPVVKSSVAYKLDDNIAWTAVKDTTFDSNIIEGSSSMIINSINGIAWGNNKFVAVCSGELRNRQGNLKGYRNSKIAYSSNGLSWTVVKNSPFLREKIISAVAYGDGKFVAVGGGGKMAYSSDGISWTAVKKSAFGSEENITCIAYGEGKFIAGSEGGKLSYSSDGISWTAVKKPVFGKQPVDCVACGGGRFVASSNSKIASSADGITWTGISDIITYNSMKAIIYGGGKFIVGGRYNKMACSSDGITWSAVNATTFSNNEHINSIAYGNGKFVAGGSYGMMAYSTDGLTWTGIPDSNLMGSVKAIVYGGGKFIAAGGDKFAYWNGNIE